MKAITFKKTGAAIKSAIEDRCAELQARLDRRNEVLEGILNDRKKVRAYMLQLNQRSYGSEYENPPIITRDGIPSEEVEEITQLCKRIGQLEQEVNRLRMIQAHLADEEEFTLELKDLVRYGFPVEG